MIIFIMLLAFMMAFGILLIGIAAIKSAWNPAPELADRIGFTENPKDEEVE